jgi:hypothetical protein
MSSSDQLKMHPRATLFFPRERGTGGLPKLATGSDWGVRTRYATSEGLGEVEAWGAFLSANSEAELVRGEVVLAVKNYTGVPVSFLRAVVDGKAGQDEHSL